MRVPRHLLRTQVTWLRVSGRNRQGEPIYADPVSIRVRWDDRRKMTRDQYGAEIVSNASVICREPVEPGDVLVYREREWPVITSAEIFGPTGRASHRELVL